MTGRPDDPLARPAGLPPGLRERMLAASRLVRPARLPSTRAARLPRAGVIRRRARWRSTPPAAKRTTQG